MYIEWAVPCDAVERLAVGYNLVGVSQNGFLGGEGDFPREGFIRLFVCFRMEPGDEEGGRVYKFLIEIHAPDGAAVGGWASAESVKDTAPRLVSLERSYQEIAIPFSVPEPGEYRVVLSDATGERYVQPFLFLGLPSV